MNSYWQAEMESEENARHDYWSEIAAEHKESTANLDAEMAHRDEEYAIEAQDAMEARGGPEFWVENTDLPY